MSQAFYRFFMIPTLKTYRLILRPFELSDIPAVRQFFKDETLYKTSKILRSHYYHDAEKFVKHNIGGAECGCPIYAITLKDNDSTILIGAIALDQKTGEIGYWIGDLHRRYGYGTQAVKKVIDYAFNTTHLDKVIATPLKTNKIGQRFLESIGMTLIDECDDHENYELKREDTSIS